MPLGAARITFLAKSQVIAVGQRTAVTITASGNAQIDTAQSKFSGASVSAGATTDNLDAGSIVLPGQADYTVEFWFRLPNLTERRGFFGQYSAGASGRTNCEFVTDAGGYVSFFQPPSSSFSETYRIKSNSTISANTWHHCAITRDYGGTGHIMYIDGVAQTDTIADHSGTTQQVVLKILGPQLGTVSTDYYMDEFRVSDIVRYTSGFTPSTEPFVNDANTLLLLHTDGTDGSTVFLDDNGTGRSAVGIIADDNAQIDNAQSKFGGTSAVFPSPAGWLQTGAVNAFAVSGDWTKEFWIYYNKSDADQYIHHNRGGYSSGSFNIYTPSVGNVRAAFNDGGTTRTINTTFSTGQWYHYALVNNSGTITWYVDGSSVGTASWSSTINDPDKTLRWGGFSAGGTSDKFEGWIDEYRFSDTARYTTSFTPDATAFENDANTLLLAHMDGTDGDTDFFDDNGQTTP